MPYSILRMRFTSPVHFGSARGGASPDRTEMCCPSDTLFSALCCEALKMDVLDEWVECARRGRLTFSDALPYRGEEYYLPKPILHVKPSPNRAAAGDRKAFSRLKYIPASRFDQYLAGLPRADVDAGGMTVSFGMTSIRTQAAIRDHDEAKPYDVEAFHFLPDCGLYTILRCEDKRARELMYLLAANLGYSGIGGRKSSGCGRFQLEERAVCAALIGRLEDDAAPWQMLLSTALPEDDVPDAAVDEGYFQLVRRGGFVDSQTYAKTPVKKRTLYALGAGSCLPVRFCGAFLDVGGDGSHPVWRSLRALFMGVNA